MTLRRPASLAAISGPRTSWATTESTPAGPSGAQDAYRRVCNGSDLPLFVQYDPVGNGDKTLAARPIQ
jgi:hypothetical protein